MFDYFLNSLGVRILFYVWLTGVIVALSGCGQQVEFVQNRCYDYTKTPPPEVNCRTGLPL